VPGRPTDWLVFGAAAVKKWLDVIGQKSSGPIFVSASGPRMAFNG
jgi:hypothetical protein